MDISSLSLAELRRLQTKVETEIRRRSDTAKKDLLKRMQKLAAEHGMSLTDVIGGQEAPEKAAPRRPQESCSQARQKGRQARLGDQVPPPRKRRYRLDRPRPQAPVGDRLARSGQGPRRPSRRQRRSLIQRITAPLPGSARQAGGGCMGRRFGAVAAAFDE